MKPLNELVRPNILTLTSALQHEIPAVQQDALRLNRGESPYNAPLNRYPDSNLRALREAIGQLRGITADCILPVCGTAEAIDILMRVFCIPGRDNVLCPLPARQLYRHTALANDVEFRTVPPDNEYSLRADHLLQCCNAQTKLILLSAPNTRTGGMPDPQEILRLAEQFDGIVVVDEAYMDYSKARSMLYELPTHPNLVVLQTFSKAWASAAIRLATCIALPSIIRLLQAIRSNSSISLPTQKAALQILSQRFDVQNWVRQTVEEREKVIRALRQLPFYEADFPTETNFILVQFKEAARLYQHLLAQGVCVDPCEGQGMPPGCLRITIGLPHENSRLLAVLRQFQ